MRSARKSGTRGDDKTKSDSEFSMRINKDAVS